MKKAVVVRCKQCSNDWYIRESKKGEFDSPITITCPHCNKVYRNISYKLLLIGKASTFNILQPKLGDTTPRHFTSKRVVFSWKIFILVFVTLVFCVLFYVLLQP